jgi:hypothetical protein
VNGRPGEYARDERVDRAGVVGQPHGDDRVGEHARDSEDGTPTEVQFLTEHDGRGVLDAVHERDDSDEPDESDGPWVTEDSRRDRRTDV